MDLFRVITGSGERSFVIKEAILGRGEEVHS